MLLFNEAFAHCVLINKLYTGPLRALYGLNPKKLDTQRIVSHIEFTINYIVKTHSMNMGQSIHHSVKFFR